ncbi:MAG: hypothetical protein JXA93_12985 [Anaerolineae bacterium]|nr:hypothetical protein [Anaerolineae bacterium]
MSDDRWAYDEILVEVSGFFTTEHTFYTPIGTLATLRVSGGMAEGEYQAAGGRHVLIRRSGCLSRSYELTDGDRVRGAAEPRGLFKQGYLIHFDGQELQLVPEGVFRQGWFLVDPAGVTLLSIHPRGVFRRGAQLIAEQPIEFPLAVLAYYLHQVIQQESAAVAATAAT